MARSSIATITEHLAEEGTGVFTCTFRDEAGAGVTPSSATWTLTDTSGAVINSREDVAISSLAASVNIVLSADDLAISPGFSGAAEERVLTVEFVYDSDAGSDLPGKGECRFFIDQLVAV
jgi:hypothetical protein